MKKLMIYFSGWLHKARQEKDLSRKIGLKSRESSRKKRGREEIKKLNQIWKRIHTEKHLQN
jgi:hypothetical protein